MITRDAYIEKLLKYRDKPFIKVLTGLRRVGKSTLIDMYIKLLQELNIPKDNILKINFELPNSFKINNYIDLSDIVLAWSKDKKGKLYILLDEIGRVDLWEKAINAFHAMNIFDIYITGSNADLLSSDLSTYLAGRYVEILVHPFSYKEFLKLYDGSSFTDYMIFGGIPTIASFELDYEYSMNALRDSFNSAIFQDVINRYKIRNTIVLERLIQYVFANTSKTFSATSISRYLKSENINVSVDTLLSYLKNIEDAFLIYKVQRNNLEGKQILKTEEKYYIADHGIREAITGNNLKSIELILENIVYIELLRRGYEVYVGKVGELEIDFVAYKNNNPIYIQVSYLMETNETRSREFGAYDLVKDNYPKYVLSMDKVNFSQNGVIHKNIEDFLLEKI